MQAAMPSIVFYLRDKDATNAHVYDGPVVETEGMSGIFFSFPSKKCDSCLFLKKFPCVSHVTSGDGEHAYFLLLLYFLFLFRFQRNSFSQKDSLFPSMGLICP